VPWQLALGEEFSKKNEFLPRVLHSGKSKKKTVDGVKSSPSATAALGELFPECTIFGTRGRALPREPLPRKLFPGEGFPECLRHSGKQVPPVVHGMARVGDEAGDGKFDGADSFLYCER
jgi:hypothetical protein